MKILSKINEVYKSIYLTSKSALSTDIDFLSKELASLSEKFVTKLAVMFAGFTLFIWFISNSWLFGMLVGLVMTACYSLAWLLGTHEWKGCCKS